MSAKKSAQKESLLALANVESFYGPIMAIRGVSLSVPPHGMTAVLGANGAGKTTILKTISGIMEPAKGQILFQGEAIGGADPSFVARQGIAHVPEGREVFPFLSVRDNLRMGAYIRRDKEAIGGDLERVHAYFPILKRRADQPAGHLSGGEQQMLAIARGLMARPKLLLLDEPSLGLSPLLMKEIFDIIRRVNGEEGVAILLVEQNAPMALRTARYGYVLENGRIVLDDSCERLSRHADIRDFYLGGGEVGERGERRWKRRKSWG